MGKENSRLSLLLGDGPLRVGGITYYLQYGKVRACLSSRKKRTHRSEAEIASSSRFAEARKLWKMYRRGVGELPVWQAAARLWGKKSDSLFHSLNVGCLSPGIGVRDFSLFHFSLGALDPSPIVKLRRQGWQFSFSWPVDDSRPSAAWDDRVYVGYFYDTYPGTPLLMALEGITRKHGYAFFTLPDNGQPADTPVHLYVFFGNAEGTAFSSSVYLKG